METDIYLEDVVVAIASQCDGARKRDGRGFNRADAQEGGRLSALLSSKIGWGIKDVEKAGEIATRYAHQASMLLRHEIGTSSEKIERKIKYTDLKTKNNIRKKDIKYNYCCFSPGGKRLCFWRMAHIDDLRSFMVDLREISRKRHGVRRIIMDNPINNYITINSEKVRAEKIAIDFNGTIRDDVINVGKKYKFLIEPSIMNDIDYEIDDLRRYERASWVFTGERKGERGRWAVFDLAKKNEGFSNAIKQYLRGSWECCPDDDWNWYVKITRENIDIIIDIIEYFKFNASKEIYNISLLFNK